MSVAAERLVAVFSAPEMVKQLPLTLQSTVAGAIAAADSTLNGHSCQPKSPQMHLFLGESVAKTPPFDVKNRHFNVKYAVYSSYCPGGDRRTGPSPQSSESSCAIISDPSK